MTRGGQSKYREDPERKCIATGDVQPKRGLIRFGIAPDGIIVPDVMEKLPGRGIWVSAERDALDKAVKDRLFARSAKQAVTVPEGLIEAVETGLVRRVTDHLGLARKSGLAVAGFEKVKSWLEKEEAVILLQASDGSERGKSKLRAPGGRGSFFDVLSASELGLSFGREHVIHAALGRGGLTERFREDAIRLSGVRETAKSIGGNTAPGKEKTQQ
ncbi:MAG: RNA-binding protein [Pseudomonadota bacterium]